MFIIALISISDLLTKTTDKITKPQLETTIFSSLNMEIEMNLPFFISFLIAEADIRNQEFRSHLSNIPVISKMNTF